MRAAAGPVTLAGAMALGIAENLVGLVVHQLSNPGAPFLFAPNVSILDMRTTVVSYGCPEWSLTQAALAQMRDEIYGIPIWAFAGASDSKTVDAQAGAEAMFSIATAMQSRCNIIHDVGYIEFGTTSSLEMLVLADELVAMSRHFTKAYRSTRRPWPWMSSTKWQWAGMRLQYSSPTPIPFRIFAQRTFCLN